MYLEILCNQKKIMLPPLSEGVLSTQKELSLWYFNMGENEGRNTIGLIMDV